MTRSWLRRLFRSSAEPLRGVSIEVRQRKSVFERDEKARIQRNESALALCDPDTFGYIQLRLRKDEGHARAEIVIDGYVRPEHWAAFREALERTLLAGSEFYPTD